MSVSSYEKGFWKDVLTNLEHGVRSDLDLQKKRRVSARDHKIRLYGKIIPLSDAIYFTGIVKDWWLARKDREITEDDIIKELSRKWSLQRRKQLKS